MVAIEPELNARRVGFIRQSSSQAANILLQDFRNRAKFQERQIAFSSFNPSHITAVDIRLERQLFLRQIKPLPRTADSFSQDF